MDVHDSDARFQATPGFGKPGPELLQPLFLQNEQFLDLFIGAAHSGNFASPLLITLRNSLRRLDAATRTQLAHAPLLIDAGLCDPERWPPELHRHLKTRTRAVQRHWLARAQAIDLARSTYLLSWYFVRTFPHTPKLLLGMSDACIAFFHQAGFADVQRLAEQRYGWIRPRWESQPHIWRTLLALAHRPPKSLSGSITVYAMALINADVDHPGRSPDAL